MKILSSPLTLSAHLKLYPSAEQVTAFWAFQDGPRVVDLAGGENDDIQRVAVLCALWSILTAEGSKCTVVAANRGTGDQFLSFMRTVTNQSVVLVEISKWARQNHLEIRGKQGCELRLIPNNPACARGNDAKMVVILGAGSSNKQFRETCEILEYQAERNGARVLRIW